MISKMTMATALAGALTLGAMGGAEAHAWRVGPVHPWPIVWVFAGVGSVMGNSIIIQQTQCREMTSREALTALVLPVVGWAFNDQASRCKK